LNFFSFTKSIFKKNIFIYILNINFILNYIIINKYISHGDWGLGIGDWGLGIGDGGLGIGDWAQSPIPNPQSPIPNPQSPYK